MKKPHPLLSKARSYWRLARKATRANNHGQQAHYTKIAELAYRQYLRATAPRPTPRHEGDAR